MKNALLLMACAAFLGFMMWLGNSAGKGSNYDECIELANEANRLGWIAVDIADSLKTELENCQRAHHQDTIIRGTPITYQP